MSFDPYLHFNGECREAMEAYRAIFGGQLDMMPYSAAPPMPADAAMAGCAGDPVAAAGSDRILHAALTLPDGRMLMASDNPETMPATPQQGVSVAHTPADAARAREVFEALAAQGGEVLAPFGPTFFAQAFGMVKDRFGTHWMISTAS